MTTDSLLDRLLDDFPEEQNPRDPDVLKAERRRGTWEGWRERFRRDIANLLATRAPARSGNAPFPRVAESVACYGVVSAPSGHSRASAPEAILKAVETFEPRFRDSRLLAGGETGGGSSPVAALSGWVEWEDRRRDLVVKVFSEGDGWKVELYE